MEQGNFVRFSALARWGGRTVCKSE